MYDVIFDLGWESNHGVPSLRIQVLLYYSSIKSLLLSPDGCESCSNTCVIELSTTGEGRKKMWWTRNHLGTYEPTGEISRGSAVYKHTESANGFNLYLYKARDCTWRTSEDVDGDDVFKSVDTAPCPTDIRQWQYINNQHDGDDFWQDGDITAKCHNGDSVVKTLFDSSSKTLFDSVVNPALQGLGLGG